MTSTLTRPAASTSNDVGLEPDPATAGTWLNTGDHKRLGILFLGLGVVSVVAAAAAAAIYFIQAGNSTYLGAPSSRLASITAAYALVIGVPCLWVGLATYVVPLQLGATRIPLPRVHNLALWTVVIGALLAASGFLADGDTLASLGGSLPAAPTSGVASGGVQLVVVGLAVAVLGLFLAGVSLLVTVLNGRTEGLRLAFMPLFSWSTLATATIVVLGAPVLLAGLVLAYFDHHHGGQIFAGVGGLRIWVHQLWIGGHPFGLLFAAAGVGLFADVVSTHLGRPLVGYPVARAAAAASPALCLLLFAGDVSVRNSPFGSVATVGGIVVAVPLLLALATFAATAKGSKPRFHASLVYVLLFLTTVGLVTVLSIAAVVVGVEGPAAEAFRTAQLTMLSLALPLLVVGAGLAHWSPKFSGSVAPAGPAMGAALLLFGGPLLLAAPGYLVGLGADSTLAPVGVAGAVLTALGVLSFLPGLLRRSDGPADPYGGSTLEWAAPSPPPLHNFDEIPDLRSAHPLADTGAPA